MNSTQPFGQRLRERRKALDMTQEELATRVGCSAALIRLIELGLRRPSRQVAGLLAAHLSIPEEERAVFIASARESLLQPLRREPTISGNLFGLPTLPVALIGRSEDVASLAALLTGEDVRLVTLTGPPGIGKTSLALQVATECRNRQPAAGGRRPAD